MKSSNTSMLLAASLMTANAASNLQVPQRSLLSDSHRPTSVKRIGPQPSGSKLAKLAAKGGIGIRKHW